MFIRIHLADGCSGFVEGITNGSIGQFAKRSISSSLEDSSKASYPPDEPQLEQQTVAANQAGLVAEIPGIAAMLQTTFQDILYAKIPNPFFGYEASSTGGINRQTQLYIVDGSETGQVGYYPCCKTDCIGKSDMASDSEG